MRGEVHCVYRRPQGMINHALNIHQRPAAVRGPGGACSGGDESGHGPRVRVPADHLQLYDRGHLLHATETVSHVLHVRARPMAPTGSPSGCLEVGGSGWLKGPCPDVAVSGKDQNEAGGVIIVIASRTRRAGPPLQAVQFRHDRLCRTVAFGNTQAAVHGGRQGRCFRPAVCERDGGRGGRL